MACVGKAGESKMASLHSLQQPPERGAAYMAASKRPARPEHKEVSEYEQREVAKERALTSCVDKHSARAGFYSETGHGFIKRA